MQPGAACGERRHAGFADLPTPIAADQPLPSWAAMDQAGRREFWASLAIRHCRGIGARSRARLLNTFGSAYRALQAKDEWVHAGLSRRQARALGGESWRVGAMEEWERVRKLDDKILLWTDPRYPQRLRELPDAPVLLYCRGATAMLQSPAFAVVGSRRATPHGCTVASYMARSLASCGIVIVSGMAQGIDRAVHEAALQRTGKSIGVLGTGINKIYPKENTYLFKNMTEQGLLLSEFAPETPPMAAHFPVRNRIISGLALGVLVVEATSCSGSLITARLALEQNRDVYAVPGSALDTHCLGCQDLVRQGARPVFSAEDILRDLADQLRPFGISGANPMEGDNTALVNLQSACIATPPVAQRRIGKAAAKPGQAASVPACDSAGALTPPERKQPLLNLLRQSGPMQFDALSLALKLTAAELSSLLIGLEMTGEVQRLPGARYKVLA